MPSPGVTYTLAEPDAVIPVNQEFGAKDRISSVPERIGTQHALFVPLDEITTAFEFAVAAVPPTPKNTVTLPALMRR